VAVLGTGITKCYPPENYGLAEAIVEKGALISQFWPSSEPTKFTFPRRNVVTSGFTQGTVVIEASRTSGAKMQARLAVERGKQVFLPQSLIGGQEWARKMIADGTAIQIDDVDDVISRLASSERIRMAGEQRHQLALDVL
jgi:DNA processing protein